VSARARERERVRVRNLTETRHRVRGCSAQLDRAKDEFARELAAVRKEADDARRDAEVDASFDIYIVYWNSYAV
jgi:hypothetical protein